MNIINDIFNVKCYDGDMSKFRVKPSEDGRIKVNGYDFDCFNLTCMTKENNKYKPSVFCDSKNVNPKNTVCVLPELTYGVVYICSAITRTNAVSVIFNSLLRNSDKLSDIFVGTQRSLFYTMLPTITNNNVFSDSCNDGVKQVAQLFDSYVELSSVYRFSNAFSMANYKKILSDTSFLIALYFLSPELYWQIMFDLFEGIGLNCLVPSSSGIVFDFEDDCADDKADEVYKALVDNEDSFIGAILSSAKNEYGCIPYENTSISSKGVVVSDIFNICCQVAHIFGIYFMDNIAKTKGFNKENLAKKYLDIYEFDSLLGTDRYAQLWGDVLSKDESSIFKKYPIVRAKSDISSNVRNWLMCNFAIANRYGVEYTMDNLTKSGSIVNFQFLTNDSMAEGCQLLQTVGTSFLLDSYRDSKEKLDNAVREKAKLDTAIKLQQVLGVGSQKEKEQLDKVKSKDNEIKSLMEKNENLVWELETLKGKIEEKNIQIAELKEKTKIVFSDAVLEEIQQKAEEDKIPIEEKVAKINEYKVMFIGGRYDLGSNLDKHGVKNYTIVNDITPKKPLDVDIFVTMTAFIAHKTSFNVESCYPNFKQRNIYYNSTNIDLLIDTVYKYIVDKENRNNGKAV